jgi:hypothetical protein
LIVNVSASRDRDLGMHTIDKIAIPSALTKKETLSSRESLMTDGFVSVRRKSLTSTAASRTDPTNRSELSENQQQPAKQRLKLGTTLE